MKYVVKAALQGAQGVSDDLTGALADATALAQLRAINTNYSTTITAEAEDTASVEHTAHIAPCTSSDTAGSYIADATATYSLQPNTTKFKAGAISDAQDAVLWDGATVILGYFLLRVDGGNHANNGENTTTTGNVTVTISLS